MKKQNDTFLNVVMMVSGALAFLFGFLGGIHKEEWVSPTYYYVVVIGFAISTIIFLRAHYVFSKREWEREKK